MFLEIHLSSIRTTSYFHCGVDFRIVLLDGGSASRKAAT
jgi:hypothetical protein